MELPFLDSFDHYTTAQITRKWTDPGTGVIVPGRNGNGMKTGNFQTSKTFGMARATMTAGLAYQCAAFGNFPIAFRNVGAQVGMLMHVGDGRLFVGSTFAGPVTGPSVFVMNLNQWYYLEFQIIGAPASLTYEVRVNGVNILSGVLAVPYPAGQHLTNVFGTMGPGGGADAIIDDLYVNEATFLGDVRIGVIRPDGPGAFADFTPNGGVSHFDRVNDITPDDDVTYLEAAAAGLEECHNMEDIVVTGAIKAVQALVCTKKTDAAAANIKRIMRNAGGGDDRSADWAPSDLSYLYQIDGWLVSPFTGVDFTQAEINGIQLGVTRTL